MACASCAKNKPYGYQNFQILENPPLRATDIIVYDIESNTSRKFDKTDWNASITNLLLFTPSVDMIIETKEQPAQEGIEFTYVTNQPLHQIIDYYENGGNKPFNKRIFVSYLLCSRLNLLHNGYSKKAIAYVLSDADIAIHELFHNSSYNYAHMYDFLEDYLNDNN